MAIAFLPPPPPVDERAAEPPARPLRQLWRRFDLWRRRYATARILGGLSDAALKDIGLVRSEIGSVVATYDVDRHGRRH